MSAIKWFPTHISITVAQTPFKGPKRRRKRKEANLRVGVNSPFPAACLQRGDPLLRERLVTGRAQLPRVARVAARGAGGLDVEPEVVDGDTVGVDGCEELVELGLNGLAGDPVGAASAYQGVRKTESG